MNDTPDHIKKKQLEIWLSKSPAERLRQFMIDNDALMQFWKKANSSLQAPEPKAKSSADQEKTVSGKY